MNVSARTIVAVLVIGLAVVGAMFYWNRAAEQSESAEEPVADSTVVSPPTRPAVPRVETAKTPYELDEEARSAVLKDIESTFHRLVVPPSSPHQFEIAPDLTAGIPDEEQYQPVPLQDVQEHTTEALFQQQRAKWFQELFLSEYDRSGVRDPRWDNQVRDFLVTASQHFSVTAFPTLRHHLFHSDRFDDQLVRKGRELQALGCTDPLVQLIVAEELNYLGRHREAIAETTALDQNGSGTAYSYVIQFLRYRATVQIGYPPERTEGLVTSFRKSLSEPTATGIGRRILYYLSKDVLVRENYERLADFAASLEVQSQADPWLRYMILGDFYRWISLDAVTLKYVTYGYEDKLSRDVSLVREIHQNHLRRAGRFYLMARREQTEFPEAAWRLSSVSEQQQIQDADFWNVMDSGRVLESVAKGSSRFWFDQTVASQIDYLPAFQERLSWLPPDSSNADWVQFQPLVDFGRMCLDSKRYDTAVPLLYFDALRAAVRRGRPFAMYDVERTRMVYSLPGCADPLLTLAEDYGKNLPPESAAYLRSLAVGIHWIRGDRQTAMADFHSIQSELDYEALRELYVDPIELLRAEAGTERQSNTGFDPRSVRGLIAMPDSPNFLVISNAGRFLEWDPKESRFVREHQVAGRESDGGHPGIAEGGQYVSWYQPPTLSILDTKNFSVVAELTFEHPVMMHRISRDASLVAAVTSENIEVMDVRSQKRLGTYLLPSRIETSGPGTELIRGLTFSSDSSRLAVIDRYRTERQAPGYFVMPEVLPRIADRVFVIDLQDQAVRQIKAPFLPEVLFARFSRKGHDLLISGADWRLISLDSGTSVATLADHSVRRVDAESGTVTATYRAGDDPVAAIGELDGSQQSLIGLSGDEVIMWDVESQKELTSVQTGWGTPQLMTVNATAGSVAVLDRSGDITVLDQISQTQRVVSMLPEDCTSDRPNGIHFSEDMTRLALVDNEDGAAVWKSEAGHIHGVRLRNSLAEPTRVLAMSSDLGLCATSSQSIQPNETPSAVRESIIRVFDATGKTPVRELTGADDYIECAGFSPDGEELAAGLRSGLILIWSLKVDSSEPIQILRDHQAAVTKVSYSDDGSFLLSGGQGGRQFEKGFPPCVRVWQRSAKDRTLSVLRTLDIFRTSPVPFGVRSLDITRDAKWILAGYGTETFLFSFDGKLIAAVDGPVSQFHPNNQQFSTTGGNETSTTSVFLRDLSGKITASFKGGHRMPITVTEFTPDGSAIFSLSPSEPLAAWDVISGDRILSVSRFLKQASSGQ